MSERISVVVPTCGRPHLLERCLQALVEQDLPAEDYEIIVADDRCDPATRTAVERVGRSPGPLVRYVPVEERHGPAAARNCGWRAARAEIVAFTDDDCVPERGWLRAGLAGMTCGLDAAWGTIVVPLPKEPTDYELDAAGLQRSEFATANCFCRKAALEAVGGLDEQFRLAWREDSDLFFSLLESAAAVGRLPEAVVVHPVRPAGWGVSIRQQRKILFDALLYKKHPRLYRSRIGRTGPPHYYAVLAAILVGVFAWTFEASGLAWAAFGSWAVLTAQVCTERLRHTSRRPRHIAEMAFTSAIIPPLAIFWRLFGAFRFRVPFF